MAQYDVTLRNYWRILRRRRSIVLFTACSLSLFSFLLAQHYKPAPIYKAQAKVQINPSVNASLAAMYGFAGGTDEIETQRAIITSYKVMESVGERLNFFKDAKTAEDTARIVLSMPSTVDTDQDGHTSIITIKTVAASAELARNMANTIADVFSEYDHGLKNEKNVKHREFVEAARDSARLKLEEAEEEVRRYRE